MKCRLILLGSLVFMLNQPAFPGTDLLSQRETTIKEHLADLQNANPAAISNLFVPGGVVYSTSQGKKDAKEFFYNFLPLVRTAHTQMHEFFYNAEHVAASFHLDFELKDGEKGDGEYVDIFEFAGDSAKLVSVKMFENLKMPKA